MPRRQTAKPEPAADTRIVNVGPVDLVRLALFGHFRLRRQGKGLRIAFGDTIIDAIDERSEATKSPYTASAQPAPPPEPTMAEQVMLAELGAALDARPENRAALRPLAYVERRLARRGFDSLADVPVELLLAAYRQLTLLTDPPTDGLGALELKLAAVLSDLGERSHLLEDRSPQQFLSRAKPVVSDARLSDFLRLADDPPASA